MTIDHKLNIISELNVFPAIQWESKIVLASTDTPIAMLFEVDIEPVCVMVICLGGCVTIGHLALYAGQGNVSRGMSWLCSIFVIASILVFLLHVAGRRIIPRPQPKYA